MTTNSLDVTDADKQKKPF